MVCEQHHSTMNFSKPHLLPHSSSCSSSYSPSSKSADINRLMDPAYASPSTSSCVYPTVYVDHHGEAHDPDYRLFPSPTDASRRQRHRQREQRHWASDDEGMDEDEEQEEDEYYSRRRSTSLTRSSIRRYDQRHGRLSPLPLALPSLSTSPSPSSVGSIDMWTDREDTFSQYDEPQRERVLRKKRTPQSSLFSSPSRSPSHLPSFSTYSASEPSSPELADFADFDEHSESVESSPSRPVSPSKSETLKKEWSAISLSVSIGMFRMKRRVKGVIGRS